MSQPVRRESADARGRGAYQVLFELGRGGMGTVYLARALGAGGFERLVVIKRLNPHLLDQPDAVRRFLDEARIAARIHHANVIGTQQVGSDEDGPFLVLDYVEGGSLEDLLERSVEGGALIPPPIVLRIALDALAGLHAVHTAQDAAGRALNILHRDVSLQNVLVGRDGVARIADFGIAKSALGGVTTDKSYVVGKLLYMPREYLYREPPAPTLDVYALGITLWLALSGHDLWPDVSEAQLITHIVEDSVPRLSTVMSIPPQIEQLVATAVHRDRAQRYPNARAMAEDIERLARQTGWVATHAEVAQFLENLLGARLAERRAKLARHLEEAEGGNGLPHDDRGRFAARAAEAEGVIGGDLRTESASVRSRRPAAPLPPKLLVLPAPEQAPRPEFADASSAILPRSEDQGRAATGPHDDAQPKAPSARRVLIGGAVALTLLGSVGWYALSSSAPASTSTLVTATPAARGALRSWSSLVEPPVLPEPLAPPDTPTPAHEVTKSRSSASPDALGPKVQPELGRGSGARPPPRTTPARPSSGIRKNPYR